MSTAGLMVCALGAVMILIAALGMVRLPDALSRQHAGTKAVTVGVVLVAVGAGISAAQWAWTWRLLVLVAVLIVTLPVASHALARAALAERARSGR